MFEDCFMYLFFVFFQNSKKGKITLENISKLPVDNLNISVSSKDGEGKSSFFCSRVGRVRNHFTIL